MSRRLLYALVLPLLIAECVAQFVMRDQQMTSLFAVLAIGVIAVRWVLGPRPVDECPADCLKCRESESEGEA